MRDVHGDPLVGYFDMSASNPPGDQIATFGPCLVEAPFGHSGLGLEIEVSRLLGPTVPVPTSGINLVLF